MSDETNNTAEIDGSNIEITTDINMENTANDQTSRISNEPIETPKKESPKEDSNNHIDYSDTFKSFEEGDLVNGIVVHIDREGVFVDVGQKSEGIIRPGELTIGHHDSPEDVVSVGDHIDVIVIQSENEDGNPVLSKKRADFEKAWDRVRQAFEDQRTITAMVSDRVKGGLVVDLGIRGFVPGSHVGNGKIKNLDKYIGQSIPLKVLEVDRERRKVILSHKAALDEEHIKLRDETVGSLKEGEIQTGVVRRITEYGAFIDLGGIDGLLHISEMSWTRINHPSEIVKVGQKLQVMVLKLNLDEGRVSLGLRQITPDPWAEINNWYKIGDIVTGPISRIVPFGAFVQLENKIEAIIPHDEQNINGQKRTEDQFNIGDIVEAKVIDIRSDERRMKLSIKQMHEDKEIKEIETYKSANNDESKTTLGDLIGSKLQQRLYDFNNEANEVSETKEDE